MYRLKSRAGRVMPARLSLSLSLFSVFCLLLAPWWQVRQGDSECFREVFDGFVDVEFFVRFPEVQHDPLNAARRVETAEYLTLEVRGELPSRCGVRFVYGTGVAALDGLDGHSADSIQDLLQRHQCSVSGALMDRVAGAGLSGAKEAPGFRAGALQPRPPINPLLTEHQVPQ